MAHLHYFVAAFAVVLMATASSAMYSKKSGVITLDQNNFDKEVLASDDFFFSGIFRALVRPLQSTCPRESGCSSSLRVMEVERLGSST